MRVNDSSVGGEAGQFHAAGWMRNHSAEQHRLRLFLAVMGAEETQIEAAFAEAFRIAREQKSVSLEKRAEATYAEYRRHKASGSGRRRFRPVNLQF